jgi:predicted RNA-binding Zn-ribbon protein involved in translation (DUF1610 family)
MNGKKIGIIVLLIAVIAGAVVIAVKRARSELKAQPKLAVDQTYPKIDVKTLEVFSETLADWQTKYAPDKSGRFKNPGTGEYAMVDVMKCASCGQLIPVPQRSSATSQKGAPAKSGPEAAAAANAANQELLREYICPRCGKHVWFPPPDQTPAKATKSKSSKRN